MNLPTSVSPKSLPSDIGAERAILGAVFLKNETLDQVIETGLRSDDFYSEIYRIIFGLFEEMSKRHDPIDLVTVTSELRSRSQYEKVGGTAALTDIFEDAFQIGNVAKYASIVREKSIQRALLLTCSSIISELVDGIENTEEYVDSAEAKIFSVVEDRKKKTFATLADVLITNMHQIEERATQKSEVPGLPTGFTDLDKITTGFYPGQIIVIAARPGLGKSSLTTSFATHGAIDKSGVVAMFSLEMEKEDLGFRFLSSLSMIDSKRLKTGRLVDSDWRKLASSADKLSKSKIFIDDSGGTTILDIRSKCRRLKQTEKRVDLVIVDYLQLMQGTSRQQRGDSSREREVAEMSRGLKELAKELKVPIIALSQLNRATENPKGEPKRPVLANLRESGAIEQDADIVCFIHRPNEEDRSRVELIIAKNRAGEQGIVNLAWLGQYTLFANYTGDPGPH
jgi:replicative DNA helicase